MMASSGPPGSVSVSGSRAKNKRPLDHTAVQQGGASSSSAFTATREDGQPPTPMPLKYVVQEVRGRVERPCLHACPCATAGPSCMCAMHVRTAHPCTWLQAVKRWFEDTYQEAMRGDIKQQALLGQMYAEGYGCEKDPKAAKEWTERAAGRGYRMQGVYCEL